MKRTKRYIFNKETLNYDVVKSPSEFWLYTKSVLPFVLVGLAMFVFMLFIGDRYDIKNPKSYMIDKRSKEWRSKMDIVVRRMDNVRGQLHAMEMRDNNLYRLIFGMEPISSDVREAGYGGVDRYSYLTATDPFGKVTSMVIESDVLTKKAYLQSKSFDQITLFSDRAEEMVSCVPNIPPVKFENVRHTSGFGMRRDPITKARMRHHNGVDLAPRSGQVGEPVYVTGDGVVTAVSFQMGGFGNYVTVDHGFGYVTRYAHLRKANVAVGQKLKRGQQIGEMGNTGRSTGTHLHYEVIYMGKPVNPLNYYDKDLAAEDFNSIIDSPEIPLS